MTVLEALSDIGKGRIIDNGCEYELIALAKGTYTFHFSIGVTDSITLSGGRGENAQQMRWYDRNLGSRHNSIVKAEYHR